MLNMLNIIIFIIKMSNSIPLVGSLTYDEKEVGKTFSS